MIPEIEVTCSGKRYFINSITVEQYKKYVSLMEKNSTEKISGVMFFNTKIMQELFENELTLAEIGEIDAGKLSPTTKSIKGSFYERSLDNAYEISVDESNLVKENTKAAEAIKSWFSKVQEKNDAAA